MDACITGSLETRTYLIISSLTIKGGCMYAAVQKFLIIKCNMFNLGQACRIPGCCWIRYVVVEILWLRSII